MFINHELQEHPGIGLLVSVLFCNVGNFMKEILTNGVPIGIMNIFQIVAWSVAIIVGAITTFEWIKKTFFKKKK